MSLEAPATSHPSINPGISPIESEEKLPECSTLLVLLPVVLGCALSFLAWTILKVQMAWAFLMIMMTFIIIVIHVPEVSWLSLFLPLEFGMVVSAAKKNCRCKIQSFMIFGSMKLQSTENTLQLTLPSPQIFLTVASEFGKLVDDKFRFNLVWTQDCPFNFLERYSSWLSCNTAYKILWHRVVETCRI